MPQNSQLQKDSSTAGILDFEKAVPYDKNNWNKKCKDDGGKLTYTKRQFQYSSGRLSSVVPCYTCRICEKVYVHINYYEKLTTEYGKGPANKQPNNTPITPAISVHPPRPDGEATKITYVRGTSVHNDDTAQYLNCFEEVETNHSAAFPFSLLHYAIIFRRFNKVLGLLSQASIEERTSMLHKNGPEGFEWITPLVCAKWNAHYIYAYDDKNQTNIMGFFEPYLDEVDDIDHLTEYDNEIAKSSGLNVFDVFFGKAQPVLDIIRYEKQMLATKQMLISGASLVMDEVGTGKTVSGIYGIRDVISQAVKNNTKAKILVVCPYSKREDWQSDLRRQLGRYAHIVDQGDNGAMYSENQKYVFFRKREHYIFICGQKQGADKNGKNSALKGCLEHWGVKFPWDLIIIDEVHLSFANYSELSANKVMLLTATPIVVNAGGTRRFHDYEYLMTKITRRDYTKFRIDPIMTAVPASTDIYVNWFREDMGKSAAKRSIRFVQCARHPERDRIFYAIKNLKGSLAALTYDQDDNYLFSAAKKYEIDDVPEYPDNNKATQLLKILQESKKSYIVFCEHIEVIDMLYKQLQITCRNSPVILACKHGKNESSNLDNVSAGQLINTLMQALRQGKRVLFITTGKTGGTGLNLGEFDGVIHYELPFTSIELEQRFGRVDRIDTDGIDNCKDMIFLVNACAEGQDDIEVNRMLYYCTTKIDTTCQYMPVRNTVLFFPEFIKRNGEEIAKSLRMYQSEPVLSEENEVNVKSLIRERSRLQRLIQKDKCWERVESSKRFEKTCKMLLDSEKRADLREAFYKILSDFVTYSAETAPARREYNRWKRRFRATAKRARQWMGIVGLCELRDISVFTGVNVSDDEDELRFNPGDFDSDDDSNDQVEVEELLENDVSKDAKASTVQRQIQTMLDELSAIDKQDIRLNDFSEEGLFYYKDKTIKRCVVSTYRNGNSWDEV